LRWGSGVSKKLGSDAPTCRWLIKKKPTTAEGEREAIDLRRGSGEKEGSITLWRQKRKHGKRGDKSKPSREGKGGGIRPRETGGLQGISSRVMGRRGKGFPCGVREHRDMYREKKRTERKTRPNFRSV